MVRFVLDMITSIVTLAFVCNELRDFVAFVIPEGWSRLQIPSRSASLLFMNGFRPAQSAELNRLFKRLMLFFSVSVAILSLPL